jgi:hypothetical protein
MAEFNARWLAYRNGPHWGCGQTNVTKLKARHSGPARHYVSSMQQVQKAEYPNSR